MNRRKLDKLTEKFNRSSSQNRKQYLYGVYSQYKTTDRVVNTIPYPETRRLTVVDIWLNGLPRVNILKEFFKMEGRLDEHCAVKIFEEAAQVLRNEKNVLMLSSPINICGDVHGQYFDLLSIFRAGGGDVPTKKYLFLGDYVDRGAFSVEVVLLLFTLKINFPQAIFLLRGNHETRIATRSSTFRQECKFKYSLRVYDACMRAFDCLPVAAVVGGKFFCVHAGIGPGVNLIEDLNKLDRFGEVPFSGPICDMLWADPAPFYNTDVKGADFRPNTNRRISCYFSFNACCKFLKKNKLSSLIRAHKVAMDGYQPHRPTESGYPSVLTVFSAPNYLGVYRNKAAIIDFDGKTVTAIQFEGVPSPYYLPNFMDAITFTLPFVAAKIYEIFHSLLKCLAIAEENVSAGGIEMKKTITLHQKVRAFGRAALASSERQRYNQAIMTLGALAPPSPVYDPPKKRVGGQSTYMQAVEEFLRGSRNLELLDIMNKFYEGFFINVS